MARPLRIALGDLNYLLPMSNAESRWQSDLYVPLNLGYLSSRARKLFGRDVDIRIFKDPRRMIEHIRDERPELIGLSAYYWNDELGKLVIRRARGIAGYSPTIVLGGPSVDSDAAEQALYKARHPGVDIVIPNEGEDGFAAVAGALLAGEHPCIDGVTGLATDLGELPSPYLDGMLDEFLVGPYQPMIQTSRLCPYTCSFCVSGKNRGKLRAFPLEQVREELTYIARRFGDRESYVLHITDENFGILERDIQVAEAVRDTSEREGYPRRVFYYNDKRFTQTSRKLQEILGDRCHHGVTLSLQSENPETLKAIKRRNLTDEQVSSAIKWAHGRGLMTTTELIFGLPLETRETFLALLDKCARLGFDAVQCYTLLMFDGIEMNRESYRREHAIETRRRFFVGASQWLDGELIAETEELVVASNTFDFDDYKFIRLIGVWFQAIFVNGMRKELFQQIAARGESVTEILSQLCVPTDGDDPASCSQRAFLTDFDDAVVRNLHDPDEVRALVAAGRLPADINIKIQPHFAARLMENEHGWVGEMIDRILDAGGMAFSPAPAIVQHQPERCVS